MQNDTASKQPSRSSISSCDEVNRLTKELAKARAEEEKDKIIEILMNLVANLKEEIQKLKDENALLKGDNPKPKIPPSNLESRSAWKKRFQRDPIDIGKSIKHCFWTGNPANSNALPLLRGTIVGFHSNLPRNASKITEYAIKIIQKVKRRGKRGQPQGKPRSKKRGEITVHKKVRLKIFPEAIPPGAVFKGYRPYLVQDISFCTNNTLYYRAQWQLPNGEYIAAALPSGIQGHYGPNIIAYILHQSHACRVTEPLLLAQLRGIGSKICSGQISAILTKNLDHFHQEANELLPVGMQLQKYLKTDDTGGRHKGVNQFTTVVGNDLFSFFSTTSSKSRVNFLKLLQGGREEYLINDDTIAYLKAIKGTNFLQGYIGQHFGERFRSTEEWEAFLKRRNIIQAKDVRLVTEATLFASLFQHGIPRDLLIHSDDAGQFDIVLFWHTLCWIHEERHYRKLVMTNEDGRSDLKRVRSQIWSIYETLKTYKCAPSEEVKDLIEKRFDEIFLQETSSPILNHRLQQTYHKKKKLLGVLERIESPLHNNSSETDERSAKTKFKVSGGTRSDQGKEGRDTFLSLKQTCVKLDINFQDFIQDRVRRRYNIPRLPSVMRQKAKSFLDKRIKACVKAFQCFSASLCTASKRIFIVIRRDILTISLQKICRIVSVMQETTIHDPPWQTGAIA